MNINFAYVGPNNILSSCNLGSNAAEWDVNFAKPIAYRRQDAFPAQGDILEAYHSILPEEVVDFGQLNVDEHFEPDGFR